MSEHRNSAAKKYVYIKKKALVNTVFVPVLLLVFMLSSCKAPEKNTATFFYMDTVMNLTIYGEASALEEAGKIIEGLENCLSVTKESSDISILNTDKTAVVSAETAELLGKALEMCRSTDGALDVSIYPVVKAWGFTTEDKHIPDDDILSELLANVDYRNIRVEDNSNISIPENYEIDLGCIAKGYTGDKILEYFKSQGIESALVNLGGNVQALGKKPDGSLWKVALTDPFSSDYAGTLEIENKTVITSGNYERYFEQDGKRYHHIIDPETGYPADNGIASVTIVADEGCRADALSTALFVMGPEKAEKYWREQGDFDFLIISSDGKITLTEGIENTFSPNGNYSGQDITVLKMNASE